MKTCTLVDGYRRFGGTRCCVAIVAIVVNVIVTKYTTVHTVQDLGVYTL